MILRLHPLQPLLPLAVLALALGCAPLVLPDPAPPPAFQNAQTKRSERIQVTVATLSPEECQQVFGLPLLDEGIQPLWVRIVNDDDQPYFFLPISMAPNYFPPLEVSHRFHRWFAPERNRQLDAFIQAKAIDRLVGAHQQRAGFVFANVDLGAKHLRATLLGHGQLHELDYFLQVKGGLKVDFDEVPFDRLHRPDQVRTLDAAALRQALEALPACVTGEDGKVAGDPMNLILVGKVEDIWAAFTRRHWDMTEAIYSASVGRMLKSFLFGGRYRYSPVSPLYAFGRSQDFAMQKVRNSINARAHLRLWLTPWRFQDKPVWVGQVSRDIGVRFTTKTWNLTTHLIDPDVDEARDYLAQDLLMAHNVTHLAYVKGVGAARAEAPRRNLTGDPYFTDGLRAVVVISNRTVALTEVANLNWDWPPPKVAARPAPPEEK